MDGIRVWMTKICQFELGRSIRTIPMAKAREDGWSFKVGCI